MINWLKDNKEQPFNTGEESAILLFKRVCKRIKQNVPLLSIEFSQFFSDILTGLDFLDLQTSSPLMSVSVGSITKASANMEPGSPPG